MKILGGGKARGNAVRVLLPVLAVTVWAATVGSPSVARAPHPGTLAPYRGLGSWVDVFDTAQFDHPWATVKKMKSHGVRTLFLETGNYKTGPIYRPAAQARFIHAAHNRDMKVIAWYLPSFTDPDVDFRRSMASVRFRTKRGQSFDGFGLDIEATLVDDVSLRKKRMIALSQRIRNAVGGSYSLGAIVPSPKGMRHVPEYWGPVGAFPWRKLNEIYDAIVPMSYFSWRVEGMRAVYRYNAFNIRLIRKETGDPKVPVHLIGGISGESTAAEVRAFVRALRTFGSPGGSLYSFGTTDRKQWRELRKIPVNPRQSPPLPIPLGKGGWSTPLGKVPHADRTHPKEVFFRIGPSSTAVRLSFEAYDVAAEEVHLLVNWHRVRDVAATPAASWGTPESVRIPARRLHGGRANLITFVARGRYPNWHDWGVRNVSASSP
jgi:hypothetical protein